MNKKIILSISIVILIALSTVFIACQEFCIGIFGSENCGYKEKSITIISPASNRWESGSTQTISWEYTGDITEVKIEILKDGELLNEYTSTSNTTGVVASYSWEIPDTYNIGPGYKVKITDTSDENVSKLSGEFDIYADIPTIESVSPIDDTIDIPLNASVSVMFSEGMDQTTTEDAFELTDGTNIVEGSFEWSEDFIELSFTPNNNLTAGHKYYVNINDTAEDLAGRSLDEALSISFVSDDGLAPQGSFTINSNSSFTPEVVVFLDLSGVSGAYEMRFMNEGEEWTEWELFPDNKIKNGWSLIPDDGTKTVFAQFKDGVGNIVDMSDSIELDTTDPYGSFGINNDAIATNDPNVIIDLLGIDGAIEVRFSNVYEDLTSSSWVSMDNTKSWTLESATDGIKMVYAQFKDDAGNTFILTDDIVLDRVAPVGTIHINKGEVSEEEYTNTEIVSVVIDVNDDSDVYDDTVTEDVTNVEEMRFSNNGTIWTTWEDFAESRENLSLVDEDGLKYIFARFIDTAGNILEIQDDIKLDKTYPTGTMAINDNINPYGNNDYSVTNIVKLYSHVTDTNLYQMRFMNENGTWSDWENYDSIKYNWDLTEVNPNNGTKTVLAQYRDYAGNVIELDDIVILDTIFPTHESLMINDGEMYTPNDIATLNSSVQDVNFMRFKTGLGTWTEWQTYSDIFENYPLLEGLNVVYAEYKDLAGNITPQTGEISVSVISDTIFPTGSMAINNNVNPYGDNDYSISNVVELHNSITDTNLSEMRFMNENGTWTDWENYSSIKYNWDLNTVNTSDGTKTVLAQYRDLAGNTIDVQDVVILDMTPPVYTSFIINSDETYTPNTTATLNSSVSGADYMRFKLGSSGDWGNWSAYNNQKTDYSLTVEGENAVYAEYKDIAGNVIPNTGNITDSIIRDTLAPSITQVNINGGNQYTNNISLTIALTGATDNGGSGISDIKVWDNRNTEPGYISYGSWTGNYTLSSTDNETRTIYVRLRDNVGNEMTTASLDTVFLDTIAPSLPSITINGGAEYTNNTSLNIALNNPSDNGSGISDIKVWDNRNSEPGYSDYSSWMSSYSLSTNHNENRTIYVKLRDYVGNENNAVTNTITFDNVAPTVNLFLINNGDTYSNSPSFTLNSDITGAIEMRFSNDGSNFSSWTNLLSTFSPWNFSGDGTKTIYAQYRDEAGNISSSNDDIILDTLAPGVPEVIGNNTVGDDVNVIFQWTSTGNPYMFRYKLDENSWSGEVTSTSYNAFTNLEQGDHSMEVIARDEAGNWSEAGSVMITVYKIPNANLIYILGGTYTQEGHDGGNFNHTLSSYYIGQYEVTYELWYTVYQWAITNGYSFASPGREGKLGVIGGAPTINKHHPVTWISWRDAIVWCNAYSELEGRTPCYSYNGSVLKNATDTVSCDNSNCDWNNTGYRLSTEGEWQFAASDRGVKPWNHVSGCNYSGGSGDSGNFGWYKANSGDDTHIIGTKWSNLMNIFDMSGNVWEWCWDRLGVLPTGNITNYRGAVTGNNRLARGGSFGHDIWSLEVGWRGDAPVSTIMELGGLRVAQSVE